MFEPLKFYCIYISNSFLTYASVYNIIRAMHGSLRAKHAYRYHVCTSKQTNCKPSSSSLSKKATILLAIVTMCCYVFLVLIPRCFYTCWIYDHVHRSGMSKFKLSLYLYLTEKSVCVFNILQQSINHFHLPFFAYFL